VIREAASHVVKDLLAYSTLVQESLEFVGQAIDDIDRHHRLEFDDTDYLSR